MCPTSKTNMGLEIIWNDDFVTEENGKLRLTEKGDEAVTKILIEQPICKEVISAYREAGIPLHLRIIRALMEVTFNYSKENADTLIEIMKHDLEEYLT